MLWLFVGLSALALLGGLTCLEYDLRERWHAARGRFGLEALRDRTRLSRSELEARVGPPRADGLFHLTPEQRAALPWGPAPFDPYHPVGNLAALTALAAGLGLAAARGAATWWAPGLGGGYLLACLAWALVGIWREGLDDDDGHDAAIAEGDAELAALERGDVDLATACGRLAGVTARLQADLAREEARDRQDALMPLPVRLLMRALWRWQRWRVTSVTRELRREQEQTAALAERIERDMLEAHLRALEADLRGASALAAAHREHEATCRRLLRGLDGRGRDDDGDEDD